MRPPWLPVFAMGVMLTAISARAQQPTTTAVAGVVLDAKDGQPLARVHVRLARFTPSRMAYGTFTTSNGRFFIGPIEPGAYAVSLERTGFAEIWQDKIGEGTFVQVNAGSPVEIKLSMEREAIFSGNVLDEYGEPVLYADVKLRPAGQLYLRSSEWLSCMTNDRGEFQFTVRPGKYYLAATAEHLPGDLSDDEPEIRTDGTAYSEYVETFFPSGRSKGAAKIIEGKAGEEINGLEIRMTRSGTRTIRGVVSGIPEGADIRVMALPALKAATGSRAATSTVFPDGRFSIQALDSGTYRI